MIEELAEGATIAERYILSRLLGEGGMGAVWAARNVVTGKLLALKFLKGTEDDHRRRFVQEARVAAAIRHPNVVDIHDVLELPDGRLILVMDLLDGEPLSAFLHRHRNLTPAELMPIALEVLSGLGAAHAVGVVHRDMKPDNIFLCRLANGQTTVKLLDFGIAKLNVLEGGIQHSGAMTQTGSLLGTPMYMAPEQVFGEKNLDHRADFWSLGVVMYECLTGACPIDGDNIGQIFKIISTRGFSPLRVRLPGLDPGLATLIDRMLSIQPEDRPDSAGEIAQVISMRMGLPLPPIPEPTWLPGARRKAPSETSHGHVDVDETLDAAAISLHPTLAAMPMVANKPKQARGASLPEDAKTRTWKQALIFAPMLVVVAGGGLFFFNSRAVKSPPNEVASPTSTSTLVDAAPRDAQRVTDVAEVASAVVSAKEAVLATSTSAPTSNGSTRNRPITKTQPTSSPSGKTGDSRVKSGPGGIYNESPY